MCLMFHKWDKWATYTESGTMIGGVLSPMKGKAFRYTEIRQRRCCLRCGKIQDEWVKDA